MANLGQPGSPVPADQVASAADRRNLFLRTAVRKTAQPDSIVNPVAGQMYPIRITATGLGRFIRIFFSLTVTVTPGTGTATLGPRGPYNYLSGIEFKDPGGNTRVNCSGYELYLLKIARDLAGADPSFTPLVYPYSPEIYNAPLAAGANQWEFWLEVPLEMGPLDTRGLVNLESANAQAYLNLTVNPSPAGTTIDSPIIVTGNATVAITGTISTEYYFYSPVYLQDAQGNPFLALPMEDLSVIHEIATSRFTQLSAGADINIPVPSGRSYYRLWCQVVSNGAMVTGQINGLGSPGLTRYQFVYNEINPTLNEFLQAYLSRIRDDYNRDFPQGTFLTDLTNRPWDSNRYGQLDVRLTTDPAFSTAGSTYVQLLRESLYLAPRASG